MAQENPSRSPVLVNLGCGKVFHPSWRNFDVEPGSPEVEALDVRTGVPVADGTCDAVYHSHVMEHLHRSEGVNLLRTCWTLLRPGGIVRIVVPNLEGITRAYVKILDRLERTEDIEGSAADLEWMTLELLDQMCRTKSGGQMREYWARETISNEPFVIERMGWQFESFRNALKNPEAQADGTPMPRFRLVRKGIRYLQTKLAAAAVRVIAGETMHQSFQEAVFRGKGEVHLWMYDKYSLSRLLAQNGFFDPKTMRFDESEIEDFEKYNLDSWSGKARKPDSLYIEAKKAVPHP